MNNTARFITLNDTETLPTDKVFFFLQGLKHVRKVVELFS